MTLGVTFASLKLPLEKRIRKKLNLNFDFSFNRISNFKFDFQSSISID